MKKPSDVNSKYEFSTKWTEDIAEFNFTQIPNILIICQGHLGLSDGEVISLIQLIKFRFSLDSKIFPSISTLADYSTKGYSTIQKRLEVLEQKGYIKKSLKPGTSNRYDIQPLVEKLHDHKLKCYRQPQKRREDTEFLRYPPSSESRNEEEEYLEILTSKTKKLDTNNEFDLGKYFDQINQGGL